MSRASKRAAVAVALGLACVVVAGTACQSLLGDPPRWNVEISSLDYVEYVSRANPEQSSQGANALRLELLGNGYLSFWIGRSQRVTDDFWAERAADEQWDKLERDEVMTSEAYAKRSFQALVDTGYFETEMFWEKSASPASNGVWVVASINGRKKAKLTDDPKIRAIVSDLLRQF